MIHVLRGETIPVDGTLISSEAIVDTSVLTGEASPVVFKKGDTIFAGTLLCASEVKIETLQSSRHTRVGQLIQKALLSLRNDQEESFFWVSRFTAFVVTSALFTFLYFAFSGQLTVGFYRAFAIVIVACPCAVSFGIPLIRSFSGLLAIKNGLVLKNPQVLKKIKNLNHICFDKTGTLTQGRVEIDPTEWLALTQKDQTRILSLESAIDHPISRGFQNLMTDQTSQLEVENFRYIPGLGIEGSINNEFWQIQSSPKSLPNDKRISVIKDGKLLTDLKLSTDVKKDLIPLFKKLANRDLKISILSGDSPEQVLPLFDKIPLNHRGEFLAKAKPETKEAFINQLGDKAMMVGDGINDIAAMQSSHLSLCMPGALENNINLADISMTRGDLQIVDKVFDLAKRVDQTERNLMILTFIYNVLCVALAAAGFITPVVAAILMPISSLTVLSLVTLSLRRL